MTKEVRIRGVTFPSQTAAARALGVKPQTIIRAKKEGRLDGVGLGNTHYPVHTLKPVEIEGHYFHSRLAAAEALGIPSYYLTGYFKVLEAMENFNK